MKDFSDKKILIFSDTHLTCKFEESKFLILKKIIQKSDLVIINGDFWEYISCSFERFVNSEWAEKLFPLLKEKKTIFLHGNHDPKRLMTWAGINKFADESEKDIKIKSGNKIFKIEHGDLVALEFDVNHKTISDFIEIHLPTFYIWLTNFEYGSSFYSRLFKKYMNERRLIDLKKIKEFSLKNKENDVFRIFGHVHMKKHNFENNFAVIGEFKNGVQNYIFIENGKVEFVSDKY